MNDVYNPENVILDPEEQWFEDHFEEYVPGTLADRESLIKAAVSSPKIFSDKKQMVSIRLDPQDVFIIKKKAERAGLGYQTMISSLLHQFAEGDLVNIEEARKLLQG